MLPAEQILAALPDGARRQRRVREVGELVAQLANAGDLKTRTDTLTALARWVIRPDGRMPTSEKSGVTSVTPGYRRLEMLLRLLESPAAGDPVRAQVAVLLEETDGVRLLAETGLPNDRGLLHDSFNRLFRVILPAPRDDHDLSILISRLFPARTHLRWLAGLPPPLAERLAAALLPAGAAAAAVDRLLAAARDALLLISARVQGLGLSPDMRERSRPLPVRDSPFMALGQAADRLLAAVEDRQADRQGRGASHHTGDDVREGQRRLLLAVAGCRTELEAVKRRLETTGISLDVVYAIEAVEHALFRMEGLAAVLVPPSGPERQQAAFHLLGVLARARYAELSLRALGYTNLHILARKLVERAGRTGEHYIALTRREYSRLLASAAGGGILTLGTAVMKVQISSMFLPLFVEGFFASVNYAISFVLIQLLGFTLATKQPSMTAATLAASIGESSVEERREHLVEQAARIVSSQLAAATGNITTVILTAAGFDAIYQWRVGHSFLTPEKAAKVLQSLHPLASGTIFYAALTGVILWISSLAGGWVENFTVYRRLPQAIAEHRAGRWVGSRFTHWASEFFARNISGYGGSVALGFMLGMTPVLGAFFGLPLDVRHVTLSTGTLAMALASGGVSVIGQPATFAAIAGIAVIFVLNLGVSFSLALMVALRAREIPRRDRWALAGAILRRLVRRPLYFIGPPSATAQRNHTAGGAH